MVRKILKWLCILQEHSNKGKSKRLGRGYLTAYRLNPYNILTYPAIILLFIAALIMFGVVGIKDQVDFRNPFKWD